MKNIKKIFIGVLLVNTIFALSGCGETKEQEEARVDVMEALDDCGCLPDEWVEIGYEHPWGAESPNYNDFDYYYIDKVNYDEYEYLWNTKDMDKDDLYDGYNEGLHDQFMDDSTEPVFHAISVMPLKYTDDVSYANLQLKKDQQYYLAYLYNRAVYVVYVSDYRDNGKTIFYSATADYDSDSEICGYMLHEENGKWISEELIWNEEK